MRRSFGNCVHVIAHIFVMMMMMMMVIIIDDSSVIRSEMDSSPIVNK